MGNSVTILWFAACQTSGCLSLRYTTYKHAAFRWIAYLPTQPLIFIRHSTINIATGKNAGNNTGITRKYTSSQEVTQSILVYQSWSGQCILGYIQQDSAFWDTSCKMLHSRICSYWTLHFGRHTIWTVYSGTFNIVVMHSGMYTKEGSAFWDACHYNNAFWDVHL